MVVAVLVVGSSFVCHLSQWRGWVEGGRSVPWCIHLCQSGEMLVAS